MGLLLEAGKDSPGWGVEVGPSGGSSRGLSPVGAPEVGLHSRERVQHLSRLPRKLD